MPLTRRYQQGLGLVELMISLVIGMIVIAGALTITASTMGANASQMKMSRLNNELRQVMDVIVRDMRRAGFHNWSVSQTDYSANPQALTAVTTTTGSESVSVSYDENVNGALDAATETFRFRHNGSGVETALGSAGSWSSMIDSSVITITALTIEDQSITLAKSGTGGTGGVVTVTVPIYSITLTGGLVSDPGVSRTIRETVRIRNVAVAP